MFTSEEYQQLHTAARLLQDKGLLQALSLPSLFCYLSFLASDETDSDLTSLAKRLSWSEERTRRCLKELAGLKLGDGATALVEVIERRRNASGHFRSKRYRLVEKPARNRCQRAIEKVESAQSQREVKPLDSEPSAENPLMGSPKGIQPQTVSPSTVSHSMGKNPEWKPKTPSNHLPSRQKCAWCLVPNPKLKIPVCWCVNKKNTTTPGGFQRGDAPKGGSTVTDTLTPADAQRVGKLRQIGLPEKEIGSILSQYPWERIVQQLEMLPYRKPIKPSVIFRDSLSQNWSAPYGYLKANPSPKSPSPNANETQEQLARIKAEQAQQKRRRERLVALEKRLPKPERDALRLQAEKQARRRLGQSWPQSKAIPQTFLNAEYYDLIEARFSEKSRNETNKKELR